MAFRGSGGRRGLGIVLLMGSRVVGDGHFIVVALADGDLDVVVAVKALLDPGVGGFDEYFGLISGWLLPRDDSKDVAAFAGLPLEPVDFSFEEIGVLGVEIHPNLIDAIEVEFIEEVELGVGVFPGGSVFDFRRGLLRGMGFGRLRLCPGRG